MNNEQPTHRPPPRSVAPWNQSSRRAIRSGRGLHDRVVEVVGEHIVNGAIAVGSTLYVEEICTELDVSRSVVREGLRTLSSMGFLESRPQRGTRVQPRRQWDLLDPRVVHWRGEGPEYLQQAYELLELRLGVEHAAAQLAATRMDSAARREVVAAGDAMERAYAEGDPHRFFEADAELHRLMLEASGNPLIAQFADTVTTALHIRGSNASRSYSRAESLDALSAGRHRQLAEALAGGDAEAAQRAVHDIMLATLAEVGELLEHRRAPGTDST